jgi:hypothetical protein
VDGTLESNYSQGTSEAHAEGTLQRVAKRISSSTSRDAWYVSGHARTKKMEHESEVREKEDRKLKMKVKKDDKRDYSRGEESDRKEREMPS